MTLLSMCHQLALVVIEQVADSQGASSARLQSLSNSALSRCAGVRREIDIIIGIRVYVQTRTAYTDSFMAALFSIDKLYKPNFRVCEYFFNFISRCIITENDTFPLK